MLVLLVSPMMLMQRYVAAVKALVSLMIAHRRLNLVGDHFMGVGVFVPPRRRY